MAQTTRSSSGGSTRSRSRSSRSTSSNGSRKTNASPRRRTSSNGARGSTSRRTTRSATRSAAKARSSRSGGRGRSTSTNGPVAAAGEKVSNVASKAKAPLIALGAAAAGVAGGVALKSRDQHRSPLSRLRPPSMPKSVKRIDLSKIDMDKVTSAAHKVRAIGEQVGDVADAAEKTRKKHK